MLNELIRSSKVNSGLGIVWGYGKLMMFGGGCHLWPLAWVFCFKLVSVRLNSALFYTCLESFLIFWSTFCWRAKTREARSFIDWVDTGFYGFATGYVSVWLSYTFDWTALTTFEGYSWTIDGFFFSTVFSLIGVNGRFSFGNPCTGFYWFFDTSSLASFAFASLETTLSVLTNLTGCFCCCYFNGCFCYSVFWPVFGFSWGFGWLVILFCFFCVGWLALDDDYVVEVLVGIITTCSVLIRL